MHAGKAHALQAGTLGEARQADAEVQLPFQPLLRGARIARGVVERQRAGVKCDAVLDERVTRKQRMREAAGEEPDGGAGAGGGDRDRARPLERAGPAAVHRLVHQVVADVLVDQVRRGDVGAQHRRLVALVQADRMRALRALGKVGLDLGALLGAELPVHVGVEEGLLELAALVRQARLLNSSTSSASSSSTATLISSACLPCTTPEATAYPSRFFCSSFRPR